MSNESDGDRTEAMARETSAVATASRDQAREVAQTAKAQAQDTVETARQEAQQLGDQVKSHAQDVFGDVRHELRERANEQGTRAAQALHDTSGQLRRMAQSGEHGVVVDLAQSAAARIEDVAGRLDRDGVDGLLDDVRSYARRRPGMFLLAAGAAGFLIGRVARSASSALAEPASPQPIEPAPHPTQVATPAIPLASPAPETDYIGAGTPSITGPPA
jgi:F0F1-type ATP synthase membrane subunit b/b'